MQIVFAWEGAISPTSDAEAGMVGSHRYLTFQVDPQKADRRFLYWWFRTEPALKQVLRISPGSAGRNRTLGTKRLNEILVPLPEVHHQTLISAWLDDISAMSDSSRKTLASIQSDCADLITTLHLEMAKKSTAPMRDLVVLDEDAVKILVEDSYPQVGIRGAGGGLFTKGPVVGSSTTYKHFNRLFEGAIVLSQPKGWEGAVAVVPPELSGWYASPEYRTFRCKPDQLDPRYASELFKTPWFLSFVAGLSKGQGARRERTRPEQFLGITLPMPTIEQQRAALPILAKLREASQIEAMTADINALLPSALAQVFGTNELQMRTTT
jgi:type I restriction enzyme S subunit